MRVRNGKTVVLSALAALVLALGACEGEDGSPLDADPIDLDRQDLALTEGVPADLVPLELQFDETERPVSDGRARLRRYVERLQTALRRTARLVQRSGSEEARELLDAAVAEYRAAIEAFGAQEFEAGIDHLRAAGSKVLEARRVLRELHAGGGTVG